MHRFDLTVICRQSLQRSEPQERFIIIPDRPKADVERLQPGDVQGMRAARRRFRPGTGQVDAQEIGHARIAEVALDNPHHVASPSLLAPAMG
jgi:hypothetical protein